ncbi:hypothetical protein [Shewanella sp. 10N.286.52.A9]|uniref:hypothetical protein n=1 Tax=Shewanella sp. 10N.286.52.A9 TaxID=3229711 RepID=UPI00354ADE9F
MPEFNLRAQASKHFSFEQLILCGETIEKKQTDNLPKQADSWRALSQLAIKLLDPLYEQFGQLQLTYGFCSPQLARLIAKNKNPHIAPSLDQHCSHEVNCNNKIICNRLGAACDFFIQDKSIHMQVVAKWISQNLKFDRMYYYGKNSPLHISYGPEMNQFLQLMKTHNATKHRSPSFKGRGDKVIQLINEVNY